MKKAWLIILIIVILLIIFGLTRGGGEPVSEEPIKIGAALSLSGIAAQDGASIRDGLELARAHLKKKGVNVDILYQDDRTEPKDTVSVINALNLQGVEAIIGPTWSYLGDAGVPVADQLEIVAVMPANTSEYVGAESPYAFFTAFKVEKIVPTLTKWLKDNDKKKIAVIRNAGAAWYEVVGKNVKEAVSNSGGEIVFEEKVIFGTEADVLPTVIAKLGGVETDLLFVEIDDPRGLFVMFKKLQEQERTMDIMSVTTALGRVLNDDTSSVSIDNRVYALAPKFSADFREVFEEMYDRRPAVYADAAYDSLMLLVEAIQKRGDTPLVDYLRNKTNYEGYAGKYRFDENGDIQDGEWVINNLQ